MQLRRDLRIHESRGEVLEENSRLRSENMALRALCSDCGFCLITEYLATPRLALSSASIVLLAVAACALPSSGEKHSAVTLPQVELDSLLAMAVVLTLAAPALARSVFCECALFAELLQLPRRRRKRRRPGLRSEIRADRRVLQAWRLWEITSQNLQAFFLR